MTELSALVVQMNCKKRNVRLILYYYYYFIYWYIHIFLLILFFIYIKLLIYYLCSVSIGTSSQNYAQIGFTNMLFGNDAYISFFNSLVKYFVAIYELAHPTITTSSIFYREFYVQVVHTEQSWLCSFIQKFAHSLHSF